MSEPQGGDRRRRKGLDNPTLDDVAREAGVSAITVSRAIHRPDSVREVTREKVEAAIAKVGYVPNMVAGTLASASSRFIPVIVPSLSNVVFVEVIQGLQAVFDQHGYQMLLGNTDYSMEREEELIRTFLGWSPTALVTTGLRHREGLSELLKRFPRPLVEIMELGQAVDMNVGMDHQRAGATMADHLLAQGYRHIVFAGTRLAHNYRAAQRYEGHRSRLVSEGLDAPLMEWQQDSHYDLGGAALDEIRRQYPQVEAIHFIDDVMASGALLEAQRQGLRVPDDIAIAGFTGLPFARALIPRLTTIVSPREAIGRLAAHQIIDRLEGRQPEACIDVGFMLQQGEST